MSKHLSCCSLQCICGELNAFTSRGEPPFVQAHICGACGTGWVVHIDTDFDETWRTANDLICVEQKLADLLKWAEDEMKYTLSPKKTIAAAQSKIWNEVIHKIKETTKCAE